MSKETIIDEIIRDTGIDVFDIDNMEDVYEINLMDIDIDAGTMASVKIDNLLRLYNDKDFIENNPEFKKRVDHEIETLRRLIKMAKTNEVIHDNLAKAISHNPGKASLYAAFTNLQRNIMSIQTQITTTMNDFAKLCKSYQTEMNFDRPVEGSATGAETSDGGTVTRGRKAVIENMTSMYS